MDERSTSERRLLCVEPTEEEAICILLEHLFCFLWSVAEQTFDFQMPIEVRRVKFVHPTLYLGSGEFTRH